MRRRDFVAAIAAIPVLPELALEPRHVLAPPGVLALALPVPEPVARDQDRFGESRQLPAGNPMWFKVAAADSANSFFLMEQTNAKRGGGPPKHLHPEQDEWFYAIEGPYVVEVGDRRFELKTGDSLLAPRGIPHASAFAFAFSGAGAGAGAGRLLVGFTPAGRMEEFFRELQQRKGFFGTGTPEDRVRLRTFGMEFVGPPLSP